MGILDTNNLPKQGINEILEEAINNGNSIIITYQNFEGEGSQRKISNIAYSDKFEDLGMIKQHIRAYCHRRKEDRTFKISRISTATIAKT